MAKKFALIKTFANGNKGVSLVAERPKEAFFKACKGDGVVEVELFRMERVKRIRVKVQPAEEVVEQPATEEEAQPTAEVVETQPTATTEETTETTSSAVEQEETQPTNANKGKGGKGRGNK